MRDTSAGHIVSARIAEASGADEALWMNIEAAATYAARPVQERTERNVGGTTETLTGDTHQYWAVRELAT